MTPVIYLLVIFVLFAILFREPLKDKLKQEP